MTSHEGAAPAEPETVGNTAVGMSKTSANDCVALTSTMKSSSDDNGRGQMDVTLPELLQTAVLLIRLRTSVTLK